MNKEITQKIKLWGIVQGVGFRPFVAKMAHRLDMKGQVLNIGGLVEITVTDTPQRIDAFVRMIVAEKPGPSEIVHIKRTLLEYEKFDSFKIIGSDEGDDEAAMIPADLAICPNCLEELYDKDNPRYKHPFISCMICGPRYTIIDKIPYDRDNTSMIDFPMCDICQEEYTNIEDRRHHAQTISCHNCGPMLQWMDFTDSSLADISLTDQEMLSAAGQILSEGGVIAFKSPGGYNFLADPHNPEAVRKLRLIKNRPSKPFAVMFRDMEQIEEYCYLNEIEAGLLQSSARPIILLEHKDTDCQEFKLSRFIGSFLPSLGAQYMLLDIISPLIFTSANLSDMPMIKDDEEMIDTIFSINGKAEGEPLVSGLLYNGRKIRIRVDDSVTRVIDDQPQMIRRSKGYAPVPLYVESGAPEEGTPPVSMLATGGQLKNSFALSKGPFAYVSQYFGDMDSIENQEIYRENITRMAQLFRIKPQYVITDMHPLYFTTSFGAEYAADNGNLPILPVQHHHAHVASVMAENNLKGKVIGVSFDGTGYGLDGNIWGGEFLLCEKGEMTRLAHLEYVEMIGGDSSMKDGTRSALSYIHHWDKRTEESSAGHEEISVDIEDILSFGRERLMSSPNAKTILKALEHGINTVKSSSMGRLFDAVSSLLGICDYNSHEGKCAIMLEDAAAFALKNPGKDKACDLALAFHERISHMILQKCCEIRKSHHVSQVALTGGTFQNKILMEDTLKLLRDEGFEPYYNISVSPNDGGIALGQLFIAMNKFS